MDKTYRRVHHLWIYGSNDQELFDRGEIRIQAQVTVLVVEGKVD